MLNIRKLTQNEFARAIRLGHGSALLHVKQFGDEGMESIIKDALLKTPIYCSFEHDKSAEWINRIVQLSRRPDLYVEHLLQNFCSSSSSLEDKERHYMIASYFDQFGHPQFRSLMFDHFAEVLHTEVMPVCALALYNVADHESLFWIADQCGKQPELMVDEHCHGVMEEIFGPDCESDICAMAVASQGHSELEPFVLACKRHLVVSRVEKSIFGSDAIGLTAREELDKDGIPHRLGKEFFKWADGVSEEQFAKFSDVYDETRDCREVRKWLKTLKREVMPSFEELKDLVFHDQDDVRYVAAEVLALSPCFEVRELALRCLSDLRRSSFSCGIEMLTANYMPGDVVFIQNAIASIHSEQDIDIACGDLRFMIDKCPHSELEPVVQWIVQECADQSTRFDAIEWLIDMDMCPLQLLWESQWDAIPSSCDYARHELTKMELKRRRQSLSAH